MATELTAERLRELLHYDPETGVFTNAVPRRNGPVGAVAGSLQKRGYIEIRLGPKRYYAHRLAWLYVYGEWPEHGVDHLNGERANNRIANLRDVTQRVNVENQRKARSSSTTGLLGVERSRGRFAGRIGVDGKRMTLGYHATAEEAHAAYLAAKRKLHEGCTI